MLAYMVKNKDWCQIPDDAISQLKASHAKSVALRRQGLHRRGADQEDEGAGGAGAAAAAAAARRRRNRCPPGRFDGAPCGAVLPDARPASLVLRLAPDFALPFVQLARWDRPDRLAVAARAVLVGDGARRHGRGHAARTSGISCCF